MASKDPSLTSDPEDQKWVVEISEILSHQLEKNIEENPSVSVFRVPKTITTKKPEAYEPQQIGLGPIHHFLPEAYDKMEQKKLGVVRRLLQDYELIKDYKLALIDKVEQQLVPVVRSCYDMFLPGDDKSLAWVFAIDGLFLLNLFHSYNSPVKKEMEEYLRLLQDKAYEVKQKIKEEEEFLRSDPEVYQLVRGIKVEEIIMESDDFLPPLLRQKDIVVTEENHTEFEETMGLIPHAPQLPKVGLKNRLVAQDVLMIENQIPFMVLKEIDDALIISTPKSSSSTHELFSPSVFRIFCEIHSPLELCSDDQAPSSVQHLLHYMYYSIVNNVIQEPSGDQNIDGSHSATKPKPPHGRWPHEHEVKSGSPVGNLYNFIIKVPQKEIVQAYEQTISVLETFTQSKTLIPSASQLHGKSGFQFYSSAKHRGIQNIVVHRGRDIYLPSITLNNDSEVILRNLVAYEAITANSDSFPLTEYMGLMCALVKTVDDVKLLKKCVVIKGEMGDAEIAKLFTGMSGSIPAVKTKGKSKLRETIDEINKVYESQLRMKIRLVLKKVARYLLVGLKAIGGFVEVSWKIVAFMVSIVTVFLLTSQAYCNAYGCSAEKTAQLMLSYASS